LCFVLEYTIKGDYIMPLTIIMLMIFLVAMILIIMILTKRKFRMKKIFKNITIIFIIISCALFSAYEYFQRSSKFIFTKTTNLTEESVGGVRLYENIDDKEFTNKYMANYQKIDNTTLFDYYKLSNGLTIATNKNRQIIRIIIYVKSDNSIKTSKGIGLGSSVDDVIKAYGENYYKRMDDIGVPVIGYVDQKRKVTIEFFNYENKVTMIRYDISSMQ
jgi:hypothetical protein